MYKIIDLYILIFYFGNNVYYKCTLLPNESNTAYFDMYFVKTKEKTYKLASPDYSSTTA